MNYSTELNIGDLVTVEGLSGTEMEYVKTFTVKSVGVDRINFTTGHRLDCSGELGNNGANLYTKTNKRVARYVSWTCGELEGE